MIELQANGRAVSPGSESASPFRALLRRSRPARSSAALAIALFHLRHLLKAGVPPAAALGDVAELEPAGSGRRLWRDVAGRVDAGASLSDALSAHPREIDPIAIALVRAGEASGRLADLLDELESYLRWRHELAARLRTVTLYPLFASLVLLAVVGFLLGYVVPSIAAFLDGGGRALPWHGALLILLAGGVSRCAVPVAGALVALGALAAIAVASDARARRARDAAMLRCGAPGRTLAALSTARWARTAALLYGSGVELGEALAVAEGTLGNRALRAELAGAREAMLAGGRLGPALAGCPSVPPAFARLVRAGEAAGGLESALRHGAAQLQLASRHAIARFEALIGPALLCLTGALLLWIALSVLSPLYDGIGGIGAS